MPAVAASAAWRCRVTGAGHKRAGHPALVAVTSSCSTSSSLSRDLDYFAHLHPEQPPDGTFMLTQPVPGGDYMLIADFLPDGGHDPDGAEGDASSGAGA